MAWNPSPRVADCREISRKWGNKEQVIIIALDEMGRIDVASYGKDKRLCDCAWVLAQAAVKGIEDRIREYYADHKTG